LGGDEFTVLLVDIGEPHLANLVAQRITLALIDPFTVAGHELAVSASIGISMTPDDGDDMDSLLRSAGAAMHAAKLDGQHRIRFHDGAMSAEIGRRVRIEAELRRAIGVGELRVHYQAKVDTRSSWVVGAEALLRWAHPSRGLTAPMEFIPIAEECGLIVPITQWVIAEVCRQLATWHREGLRIVPVSINLDATSLQSADFVAGVVDAVAKAGVEASFLEFEVTETGLMRDLDRAALTLAGLRQIGVRLSIDDFGTGYSSLNYLKRFPFDGLKIDRSFVQDLGTNANDAALTSAIIAMGNSLHLELVAEGVETWEQVDFLARHGCFLVQGFLFSKAMPSRAFADLVRSGLPGRPGTIEPSLRARP
jgi:EAL domain-containing protein (putative c-di-GMP-specific phosphodiesterase class I)